MDNFRRRIYLSQTQQQKHKFQKCRNNCGVDIFFEYIQLGRTATGGWVPLQLDSIGQIIKHDCPNKPKKTQDQQQPSQQQLSTDRINETKNPTSTSTSNSNNVQQAIALLSQAIELLQKGAQAQ
jgi:hypothetical protein